MMARRWIVALSVAWLLLLAASTIAIGPRILPGPLDVGPADSSSESGSWDDVGDTLSWGIVIIRNAGKVPLTIRSISLVPRGDTLGVRVEGIYLADMADPLTSLGMAREWRQSGILRDPAGYVLRPGTAPRQGAALFVHLVVTQPGDWSFSGFTVRYHVGPFEYTASHSDGVRVCAPKTFTCGGG